MPSARAHKLLERARGSAAGWTRNDLNRLYLAFGFVIESGSKHDVVKHPDYPQLRATLPRHTGDLALGYISYAVRLIEGLSKLAQETGGRS